MAFPFALRNRDVEGATMNRIGTRPGVCISLLAGLAVAALPTLLLGRGDGNFPGLFEFPFELPFKLEGGYPGDFNGDGKVDFLHHSNNTLWIEYPPDHPPMLRRYWVSLQNPKDRLDWTPPALVFEAQPQFRGTYIADISGVLVEDI